MSVDPTSLELRDGADDEVAPDRVVTLCSGKPIRIEAPSARLRASTEAGGEVEVRIDEASVGPAAAPGVEPGLPRAEPLLDESAAVVRPARAGSSAPESPDFARTDRVHALERTDRITIAPLDQTDRLRAWEGAPGADPLERTDRISIGGPGAPSPGGPTPTRARADAGGGSPRRENDPDPDSPAGRLLARVRREVADARAAAQARRGGAGGRAARGARAGDASPAPAASAGAGADATGPRAAPAPRSPAARPAPARAPAPSKGGGAAAARPSAAPPRSAAGAKPGAKPAAKPLLDPESHAGRLLARVRRDPSLRPARPVSDPTEAGGTSAPARDAGPHPWLVGLLLFALLVFAIDRLGAPSEPAPATGTARGAGAPDAAAERPLPPPPLSLGAVPPSPPPEALTSPRPEVRRDAVTRLGHGGAEAVAPLVRALADPDPGVRERARRSLERLRVRRGIHVLGEIRAQLDLAVGRKVELFVEGLGAGGPEAVPDLLRVIDGRSPERLKLKALAALGQTGAVNHDGARTALTAMLFSESEVYRAQACVALGRVGGFGAIPALLERLNDPSQTVRQNAHWALRTITGQGFGASYAVWASWWNSGIAELWATLDVEVRGFANHSLAGRRTALARLGAIKDPRVVDLAQLYLWQLDPELRRIAARVLGAQGRLAEPAVPYLIQALPDKDGELAREAHRALVAITAERLPLDQAAWIRWWQLDVE